MEAITTQAIDADTEPGVTGAMALSVVIPVYNEDESVPMIHRRITEVLAHGPEPYRSAYEIILSMTAARIRVMQCLPRSRPPIRGCG
ncbi:MAG: hypothetical protein HC822_16985 [Oscillochloris sp.]|nr:hypothetical protein [Oscillochloris sp.]